MDKYTVDLDKVLNDFEYSEYSLESAKVSKNIQDEHPNTSFNTNHCSRTDTSVKHSINNVFHSLNEYLSSDITPKKTENLHKTFKGIDISNETQASSFFVKSQPIGPRKLLLTPTDTTYHFTVDPAFNNISQTKDNLNGKEFSGSLNNCLVDKTDTCAINSQPEIFEAKSDTNLYNVDIPVKNTFDNKCLPEDKSNEPRSLDCQQNSVEDESLTEVKTELSNEISEEILVDLSCKDSCDTDNIVIDKGTEFGKNELFEIEENKLAEHTEIKLNLNESSIKEVSSAINNQETVFEEEVGETKESINSNKKTVEFEETIPLQGETQEITLDNEETNPKIEKIGFDKDVELDEENIEQYFQELEEELGINTHEDQNFHKHEESESNIAELQLEVENLKLNTSQEEREETEEVYKGKEDFHSEAQENSKEVQQTDSVHPIETVEEIEKLSLQELTSVDTHCIEKSTEDETSEGHSIEDNKNIVPTTTKESSEKVPTEPEKLVESSDKISSDEVIANQEPNSELKKSTEESHSPEDPQEPGKNSRPQILPLSEESQEPIRKISLIGEPGSTPYNNLYSTKDFGKTISEGSGDYNTKRAASPTYSDVSTDSVTSTSSDDTAEYNDAVSEVQNKQEAMLNDPTSDKIVQNNMVHPVETSRSDVTMDKDFKNNLKTGNVRSDEGPSTSGAQSDETEVKKTDMQELEGACAMDIDESITERQELVQTNEEQTSTELSSNNVGIDWLGKQAPLWIPDNEAMSCLHCDMKFTVIKRRHHCRACGLVLCSKCCNLKFRLEYLNAEARVCRKCFEILDKDTNSNSGSEMSQESASPSRNLNANQDSLGQPNPNNPLEYCSTIPPTQQVDPGALAVPSVMVPVGVLKRKGSNKGRSNKSVMFCDGIRPGSDLTNLDTDFNYSENQKSEKLKKSPEKSPKIGRNLDMVDTETKSFIPNDERSLPPTVTIFKTDVKYSPCANNSSVVEMLRNESLTFALQSNVFVHVKIINMECCVSRIAWCFSTEGLINVGQDEIVILLEFMENEALVPKEIFVHLNYVYLEAVKGSSVKELGMSLHPNSPFLGSKNHFGFIYIRPTFQCLQNVIIPKEPYLIGILIHRWETPWAKLFPLRLVLRLGAEYKYYPSPIISTRDRDSVFVEIGHTIINLLADFRNFSYTLPQIRGLTIHMEDKNTTVTIPKNRYDQVLKSLSNSSDHILAFAGNFSSVADSHLVCIQDTQSATNNYSTHAINICNQPRKVTGASFIVFNGALKSTSGLTAKSNIVEDGLMIQILPEHMLQVRDSLKNMRNHTIKCGCVNEESDETVTIIWGEPDTSFNVGVLSPIDNKVLTGIPSIRVHNGKDYTCNSGNRLIRWTEVFITQSGEEIAKNQDSIDISKISESISKATCQALVKYLDLLVSNSFYKIGLRAHIHVENVSYSAGSNNVKLPPIYMKSLDNELIPVLHRIASNNITEQPIVLELIFRILTI